jgi:hypothetical protein
VALGRTGIFAGGRTDLGATIAGVIANNILAFNTSYDLGIDPGLAVANDHNLVTSTGGYGFDAGFGTIVGDPLFVNAGGGDFHLTRASLAVGAAVTRRSTLRSRPTSTAARAASAGSTGARTSRNSSRARCRCRSAVRPGLR